MSKKIEFLNEMISEVFGIKNFRVRNEYGSRMLVEGKGWNREMYVDVSGNRVSIKFKYWGSKNLEEMKEFLREREIEGKCEIHMSREDKYFGKESTKYLYVKMLQKAW